MAKIGNWGKQIKFEVSAEKTFTFQNLKRTSGGRWVKHTIIGGKAKSEYQGAEARSITMDIKLSAEHGVQPRETIDKIISASEEGTIEYLVIGGKKMCSNKMYIESVSEAWDVVMNKGELVTAKLSLTFTEY